MAPVNLTLRYETDAVVDSVRELIALSRALAGRHGSSFRALDRDIDAFLEDGDLAAAIEVHTIGDGTMVAAATGQLTDLLKRGRALGAI